VHLLRLLPTYASSPLVRTRAPALLATCHTIVDVGGEYDAARHRFDHHQRGFAATFPGRPTKLSAAGLVYTHLGRQIIASLTGLADSSPDLDVLHRKMYTDFIEAFDANDNGIAQVPQGTPLAFDANRFSIAAVVNRYNYAGRDAQAEESMSADEAQAREDARFLRASAFVGEQFELEVQDAFSAWLPARAVVRQAYAARHEAHPSGKVMVLPHRTGGLPWADHLYEAEEEDGGQVLYVLFPENGAADSKWRIRSVSVEKGSFKNRKDMPDAWKGLRDEELSKVAGIDGCVFVHASGFIGGNVTEEGVKQMAAKAVEWE